jgi:GNAT superfamily N-acetyltransferase
MADEKETQPTYIVEAFDPKRHDRASFSCGVERIDNSLQNSAKKHQKGDFARIFVALRQASRSVEGFYVLNAHAAEASDFPPEFARHGPGHGQIPGAYLSIIGVNQTAQGSGLGRALMIEAFRNVVQASVQLGVKFLMLDVLDDGNEVAMKMRADFYRKLGFISLPSRPMRMFIPVATIRTALEPN